MGTGVLMVVVVSERMIMVFTKVAMVMDNIDVDVFSGGDTNG